MKYTDKNGTILKVGDTLKDKRGRLWKIENVRGVTMMQHRSMGRIVHSIVMKRAPLNEMEVAKC